MFLTKYPLHVAAMRPGPNKPFNGWDTSRVDFQHKAVMALFEDNLNSETPRKALDILFRVEKVAGQAPYMLVQSKEAPVHIPEGVTTKEFVMPSFMAGDVVTFKLSVNAISREHGNEIRPIADIDSWLPYKLGRSLADVNIITHSRNVSKGSRPIQVDVIEGFAVVADPEKLKVQMCEGVGRAKAYGCGLLSVAKVG